MAPRDRNRFPSPRRDALYRELLRHAVVRLLFLYFTPLLLLALFFHVQYRLVVRDLEGRHLQSIAEHQAGLLNMYLGDRLLNLAELGDESSAWLDPKPADLAQGLAQLQEANIAFVDLTVFDAQGQVLGYTGPFPDLSAQNYANEAWFQRLQAGKSSHVITDVYLGFRGQPHFTMALKLEPENQPRILRAALSPEQTEIHLAQLSSGQNNEANGTGLLADIATNIWLVAAVFCLIGGILIWFQARWVARQQLGALRVEQELSGQLVQASKLAAVGELAAGVAHEINNPLAVISEKTGLVQDLMDPRFAQELTAQTLNEHMTGISDAVFRCTEITRQLLGFVRPSAVNLEDCYLTDLVDRLVSGLLATELEVAGIKVVRRYASNLPPVIADAGQLEQVVLNLIKNAIDAITGPGTITITAQTHGPDYILEFADTGCGMTPDQVERVFIPFFTSKAPGKGTGLGMSVSYRIIKDLGGEFTVHSTLGQGTTFTIEMPLGR